MPIKLDQTRQHELKFLCHQKKREEAEGEDDGSLARSSSLDLSQELREAAQGCFSSALKRPLKALCGRLLGKWSLGEKKYYSLYKHLHMPTTSDHVCSPLKARDPKLPSQKPKSKSRDALLNHNHNNGGSELQIKDVHLDPNATTFSDEIKSQGLLSLHHNYEIKPQDQTINKQQGLLISGIDYGANHEDPGFYEQQDQLIPAPNDGFRRQIKLLPGITELIGGIHHGSGQQTPMDYGHSTPPRAFQIRIPKPNFQIAEPNALINLQESNALISVVEEPQKIMRLKMEDNYNNNMDETDDYLSSLASHVFSLRTQLGKGGHGGGHYPTIQAQVGHGGGHYPTIQAQGGHGGGHYPTIQAQVGKGGHGGGHYPTLQAREARRFLSNNNINDNIHNTSDIKKSMMSLISGRRFEDLADMEEFLQCYMRLYSPCFLDMVNQFFHEICTDIFECEGFFEL